MTTIIRKTAIALLLAIAGAVTASAGQYYDLAVKAFETGDYERCIELFEKKIPAEIKQEKKAAIYNPYSWWPYIESAFAVKDFKRAFHGITDNHRIINKKYWIDDRWWNLTPHDLELWPEDKKPLLDVVLKEFCYSRRHDAGAFRNSPLVRHIASTGRCTVDDLAAQAAQLFFDKSNESLKYHGDDTLYFLRCAADFGHVDALKIAGDAFEKGFITLSDGERLPVTKDPKLGLEYWKKLCTVTPDDMFPFFSIGQILLYGDSIVRDPAAALGYCDKAIERIKEKNVFASAAYKNRANCYLELGDTLSFFNKNKEAFELGYNSVAHNLGNCYKNGYGTPVDFEKAFEAYSAGLEKQDVISPVAPCKWDVAMLLRDGKGCTADPERAFQLLKEASEAGVTFAQYTLAEEYYKRQQWAEAMKWCRTVIDSDKRIHNAARASVCKMMARMYTHGRGVEADEAQAQQWWDRAASYGDDDAEIIRQWLGIK